MTDIHLRLFTPLIEMQDSLDSARVTAEYADDVEAKGSFGWKFERDEWLSASSWHLANAIGWASK